MQRRVKDAANLEALLIEEFIEAEFERDEIEIEREEGWSFHIVRIVAIFILILVIIWGIMNIFK